MKQELFNIGEYGDNYDGIDRLDYKELENLNGDNIFLAFLKENENVSLNTVAAINGRIYNFNTHKFIKEDTCITYARTFSDIMPTTIWRLVHIVNHDIVSVDIDDYKSYLIDNFDDWYHDKTEKGAKEKILKHGYITPSFKKMNILTEQNLKNINGSNIFLAILEKANKGQDFRETYQNDSQMMQITYEEIDTLAKILKDMVQSKKILLHPNMDMETFLAYFKLMAKEDLDRYWNIKMTTKDITANFIASINGHVFNFCTNQYLNLDNVDINYVAPIDKLISDKQWHLSFSDSGKLKCLAIDESAIDTLTAFQITYSEEIDKSAKARVLKNGYQIKS